METPQRDGLHFPYGYCSMSYHTYTSEYLRLLNTGPFYLYGASTLTF